MTARQIEYRVTQIDFRRMRAGVPWALTGRKEAAATPTASGRDNQLDGQIRRDHEAGKGVACPMMEIQRPASGFPQTE